MISDHFLHQDVVQLRNQHADQGDHQRGQGKGGKIPAAQNIPHVGKQIPERDLSKRQGPVETVSLRADLLLFRRRHPHPAAARGIRIDIAACRVAMNRDHGAAVLQHADQRSHAVPVPALLQFHLPVHDVGRSQKVIQLGLQVLQTGRDLLSLDPEILQERFQSVADIRPLQKGGPGLAPRHRKGKLLKRIRKHLAFMLFPVFDLFVKPTHAASGSFSVNLLFFRDQLPAAAESRSHSFVTSSA